MGHANFLFRAPARSLYPIVLHHETWAIARTLCKGVVNLSGQKGKMSNKGIVFLCIKFGEICSKQRFCVIRKIEYNVAAVQGGEYLMIKE